MYFLFYFLLRTFLGDLVLISSPPNSASCVPWSSGGRERSCRKVDYQLSKHISSPPPPHPSRNICSLSLPSLACSMLSLLTYSMRYIGKEKNVTLKHLLFPSPLFALHLSFSQKKPRNFSPRFSKSVEGNETRTCSFPYFPRMAKKPSGVKERRLSRI